MEEAAERKEANPWMPFRGWMEKPMPVNDITHEIIAAAMEVHCAPGPGLLGSAFEK
jgi:hypothetical protein